MPETELQTVTGAVTEIEGEGQTKNGSKTWGSIKVDGFGHWLKYSQPDYRGGGPWEPPANIGDVVQVGTAPTEYNGKPTYWVKAIQVIERNLVEREPVEAGTYLSTQKSYDKSLKTYRAEMIAAASEAMSVRAPQDYDMDAFGSAVVALAAYWVEYIETGFSGADGTG